MEVWISGPDGSVGKKARPNGGGAWSAMLAVATLAAGFAVDVMERAVANLVMGLRREVALKTEAIILIEELCMSSQSGTVQRMKTRATVRLAKCGVEAGGVVSNETALFKMPEEGRPRCTLKGGLGVRSNVE